MGNRSIKGQALINVSLKVEKGYSNLEGTWARHGFVLRAVH